MKRILFLVLVTSITSGSFAQYQPKTDEIFEVPTENIKRKFLIELGRSDKMQIELTNIKDLERLRNIDSILGMFLRDTRPLKDSLTEGIYSLRVDYIVDTSRSKKIRIQKYQPSNSHYAVIDDDVALLKLEQDTISIIGREKGRVKAGMIGHYDDYTYYRVSFFLNKIEDLALYVNGLLNEKVRILEQGIKSTWLKKKPSGVYLKADPDISAPNFRGFPAASRSFSFRFGVNLQNYKNYFVPSASWGFVLIRATNLVRHKMGMQYENHFFFSKSNTGKLETFRNDFITAIYERENVLANPNGLTRLSPTLSLGYLTRRSGDYYGKHTWRLGLGRFSPFGGAMRLEPAFFFNDFFKRATPSLRITQYF